jgi:hypothetical protein
MTALSDAIRRLYETDPGFEVYAYLADEVEKVEAENTLLREDLEALARRHEVTEAARREWFERAEQRQTGADALADELAEARAALTRVREVISGFADLHAGDFSYYEWSALDDALGGVA